MQRGSRRVEARNIYLWSISLIGAGLVVWGLIGLPAYEDPLILLLLMALGAAAQATSTAVQEGSRVEVGTAVSMAAVALYDPFAGVLVAASIAITITIISLRGRQSTARQIVERIGFNLGIATIAIFVAGLVFYGIFGLFGEETAVSVFIAWVVSALVNDQVNLWLLIGILHLQRGIKPLDVWLDHKWIIPINLLVMAFGGGMLAFATAELGFWGVIIFFLPILLSSYSIRLYVTQAQQQMDNLEELVETRTSDLAFANDELATLNDELATLNEDMSALAQEKDAFLSVLTHDMRTPLTSIKGFGEFLRNNELPRPQQVNILNTILRNQDALLELVNNILEIEKLQSGTPILLERTNIDLAELTKLVVDSIMGSAKDHGIHLECEIEVEPIIVSADKIKIQRVLQNLISNAIKYTPKHGRVWVRACIDNDSAMVRVQDNGYGIPADELPHIFDRYSRVKGHKHLAVGTGLGLAIVQSLVEAHGGKVVVTSVVDEGSTFILQLPF